MKRLIILLLLLVLISCGQGSTGTLPERVGKQGVVISFIDNAPPRQIYEDLPMTLGLTLQNEGYYTVENLKLVISEGGRFQPFEQVHYATLPGKTLAIPSTEAFPLYVDMTPKQLFDLGEQDVDLDVAVCYSYGTLLTHHVCIDADPLTTDNDPDECKRGRDDNSRTESLGRGQGAPVAITSFVSRMIPTQTGVVPEFEFVIENVGRGKVVAPTAAEKACSSQGLLLNEIGVVDTSEVKLGFETLTCNQGRLRIETIEGDKEERELSTITCRGAEVLRSEPSYLGSVSIALYYGYQEKFTKEVTITERKV